MIRIDEKTDLAALIRSLMADAGMGTSELAQASGYRPDRIAGYRWAKRTPTLVHLAPIAAALGYDIALIPRERP